MDTMYQALYRQYRPKTFDEVLGQEHITTTIKNQIKKIIILVMLIYFLEPRVQGKPPLQKFFFQSSELFKSKDGNPCNECEICKGILDESIMDVIEMDAASNRRIDDIRELKDKVVYPPPSRTKYKYI